MQLFIYTTLSLLYASLLVCATNSQLINTYIGYKPIDIKTNGYRAIKPLFNYVLLENYSAYNDKHNIIDALVKELLKRNKQNNRIICHSFISIYGFNLKGMFCRDILNVGYGGRSSNYNAKDNKHFMELTKKDLNNFSQDYIDINDLSRSYLDRFSNDYLDVGDLGRRMVREQGINDVKADSEYHQVPSNVFDSLPSRKFINNNKNSKKRLLKVVNGKPRADSGESTDSSYENFDDSSEEVKRNRFKIVKPMQAALMSSEDELSVEVLPVEKKENTLLDESQSDSTEESVDRPTEDIIYMQGRNRIVNSKSHGGRKRLEHFMPKRFHWNEEETKDLGYYWFNGHKGKYADAWRPGNL